MRAVIVAAVSTETQAAEDKASVPEQLALCEKACQNHEWSVVQRIVIAGYSRDYLWLDDLLEDCPEYSELVDLVRAERVDVIVCRHYDRLWRTSFLQSQMGALCAQHRVQVYSVLQPQEPVPPERLHRRRGLSGIVELLSGALSEEEQKLRMERREARVRKMIAIALGVAVTLSVVGCDIASSYSEAAIARTYHSEIELIIEEWDDALAVASVTARIELSGPVADLQAIRRRARHLEPPDDLAETHAEMVRHMDDVIETFLDFMAQD